MEKKEEIKKITTVPEKKGFSGLLLKKAKDHDFTPNDLLDKMCFNKEGRPVFTVRPFSYLERHEVEAEIERIQAESFAWCKLKGVDPARLDANGLLALRAYTKSLTIGRSDGIVKSCLLKVDGKDFEADSFERLHPKLIDALFDEIRRISYLTDDETTAL